MAGRTRSFDWGSTRLGSVAGWPVALRTAISLALDTPFPMAVLWGPDAAIFFNDAFTSFAEGDGAAALGQPLASAWPEAWPVVEPLLAFARRGDVVTAEDSEFAVARDGLVPTLFTTFVYSPIRDDSGGVGGVALTAGPSTPRVIARRKVQQRPVPAPTAWERRVNLQLDFFANLGDRVARTLDRHDAVNALAEGLVPDFADWTLVNLENEHGKLVLRGAYHFDPDRVGLLAPFIGESYDLPDRASVSARVFESGEALLLTAVSPAMVRPGVKPEFADVVDALGMHSCIAAPIAANGRVFGSYHVLTGDSDRAYAEEDLPFFVEVGRRMGYALQNAELYEREARIAHAFQTAALPERLPAVPGLAFSSLYEAGSREAQVGGDFYDAFRLPDGRVVAAIGDVAGSGVQAAATMAALRQSIRAIASVNADPELILRAADGVFSDAGRPPFASAFVAVIDPLTSSMQHANAGHPAPILRHPDGSIEMLESADLLLGLNLRNNYGSRRVFKTQVPTGSLLALYTDGITEVNYDAIDGERRLVTAVQSLSLDPVSAESAATAIREHVLGEAASHDDTAILTVLFEPIAADFAREFILRGGFSCDDPEAAHRVRDAIVSALRERKLDAADMFSAETVFSELIGNALRYAEPALEVMLDLTQESPVLHVLDNGDGYFLHPELPADAYAERGRGLYIVIQLTREFRVTPRTTRRGSHARAVLRGRLAVPHPGSWRPEARTRRAD